MGHFNHLAKIISYVKEGGGIDSKIHNIQIICGVIHRILENEMRSKTKIKLCKTMAVLGFVV